MLQQHQEKRRVACICVDQMAAEESVWTMLGITVSLLHVCISCTPSLLPKMQCICTLVSFTVGVCTANAAIPT